MERKYVWKEMSDTQAFLYDPGGELVAEVAVEYQKEDMSDLAWRVTSENHECLNLEEYNTAIPLRDMERRVLVLLGSEMAQERDRLAQRQRILDADISGILGMLWEQETIRSENNIRMIRWVHLEEAV